jgi:hypothetical protein
MQTYFEKFIHHFWKDSGKKNDKYGKRQLWESIKYVRNMKNALFDNICCPYIAQKLAALSMLHKAKKASYACNRVAARTGCVVHAPCLLAVR